MTPENVGQSQVAICKIVKVVRENDDINTVYLEGVAEQFAGRKAGQFLSVSMPVADGWSRMHPFTISSAPEEPLLSLTIRKQGEFTSVLPDLKPGTPLKCMGPLGVFCQDIDSKPFIVMIAGGVGVTPFLSVLRHFRNTEAGNKVKLFWVNKIIADVFCVDEINEMTNSLDLTVVHCLSRENDAQRYFQPHYARVRYEKGHVSADILKRRGVNKDDLVKKSD